MGASIAKSTISSLIDNSINVINNYEQTCLVSPEQQVKLDFNGCTTGAGSKIIVENNQFIKQSCITNATTQVAIASSVNQAMRQQTSAIVQSFAFGTVADAETLNYS